jgi:hypothetical protein
MARIKFEEATNTLGVYYQRYALSDTCGNGHERTADTTRINPQTGNRTCRICQKLANRRWRDDNRHRLRQMELERYYRKKVENAKSEVHETPARVAPEGEKG